jgi:hypothetical protein
VIAFDVLGWRLVGPHGERWPMLECIVLVPSCGAEVVRKVRHVKDSSECGHISSCGCWRRSRSGRHVNGNASATYRSWSNMIQRCENRNNRAYCWYGGRGVIGCQTWRVGPIQLRCDGAKSQLNGRKSQDSVTREAAKVSNTA